LPFVADEIQPDTRIKAEAGNALDFFPEFGRGVARGFMNVGSGIIGTAEFLIPGKQESMLEAKQRIQYASEKFNPTKSGAWAWSGRVIGEALPYMGSALIGGEAAGLVGAAAVGFAVEGDQAYDAAIKGGASRNKANVERMIVGTINATIEAAQIGRLLKFKQAGSHSAKSFIGLVRKKAWSKAGKQASKFTGQILRTSIEESIEEFLQEGVSLGTPALLRGEYPKKPDGSVDWISIGERLGGAALGGSVAGGVLGGVMSAMGGGGTMAAPTEAEVTQVRDSIMNSKISDPEKNRMLRQLKETQLEDSGTDINLLETEAVKEFDSAVDKLGNSIEEMEVNRTPEKKSISRELGRRFGEYEDILSDVSNPREALSIAKSAMSGSLKQQFTPLKDQFTEADITTLFEAVRSSSELSGTKMTLESGLNKLLFEGKVPAMNEIKAIEGLFGTKVAKALLDKRSLGQKGFNIAMDALNLPRALLASYDMSAPGRQGLLLAPLSPKTWLKATGSGYRAMASPEYAKFVDLQIKTNPLYKLLVKSGLDLSKISGLNSGEEMFYSNLADKLPVLGTGVRASERAYTTTLNTLRAQTFYRIAGEWQGSGKHMNDYKKLAEFINHATGRGTLPRGWERKYAGFLNIAFFAPRLQIGRIQALTDVFGSSSAARQIVSRDLVSAIGIGALILGLLNQRDDVEVETSPYSSDFWKAKVGNTRLDFLGGYSQIFRFTAQMIMAKQKSISTGEIFKADRGEIIWRYIQTKLSPPAGFAVDAIRGETFLGEKLTFEGKDIAREAFNRFVPLFIQDVHDAIRYQGMDGLSMVTPLAFHGIGAMTYPKRASQETLETKDAYSQEVFGKKWMEIGPDFQKALRENFPQIGMMESKAKMERENYGFISKILERQQATGKKIQKGLPKNVRREMESLGVGIGGLSQTISSDWRLTDAKYKQYQDGVSKILNKLLPAIISRAKWKTMPPEIQRALLEEAIKLAKESVRSTIVREATIKDLEEYKSY